MRVLSIDLGGAFVGWADFRSRHPRQLVARLAPPELRQVGRWNLQPKRTQSPGVRWIRLDSLLEAAGRTGPPIDLVAYEEVRNHRTPRRGKRPSGFAVQAAHVYGAAEGKLLEWTARHELEVTSVTVQQIKTAAIGKGGGKGATKAAVLDAARQRWPTFHFEDDNVSDAAFIGLAVLIELGKVPMCPSCPLPLLPAGGCSCGQGRLDL